MNLSNHYLCSPVTELSKYKHQIKNVSCSVFVTSFQSGTRAGIPVGRKKTHTVSSITSGLNTAKYNCSVAEARGNGDAYQQGSALSTALAHHDQDRGCSGRPLGLTA